MTSWCTKLLLMAVLAHPVFMSNTEGTLLLFESKWLLQPTFRSPSIYPLPPAHPLSKKQAAFK